MSEIVFLRDNTKEPFTTSDVIAKFSEVQHHTITRLIQQHESDFKEFGILRFKIKEIIRTSKICLRRGKTWSIY